MTYRSETRIIEDRFLDVVRVLAPAEAEEWPKSPEQCAEQHLYAELQGRWVREEPMPYRVEVRVWEDEVRGAPAAAAAWDEQHGVVLPRALA